MRKKIFRTVAILTCFSILTLSIPGSISAEKKANKFSFNQIFSDSLLFISSILPMFSPNTDTGKDITLPETNNSTGKKIKITDGVTKPKPPDDG